jgi:hypothetical protein
MVSQRTVLQQIAPPFTLSTCIRLVPVILRHISPHSINRTIQELHRNSSTSLQSQSPFIGKCVSGEQPAMDTSVMSQFSLMSREGAKHHSPSRSSMNRHSTLAFMPGRKPAQPVPGLCNDIHERRKYSQVEGDHPHLSGVCMIPLHAVVMNLPVHPTALDLVGNQAANPGTPRLHSPGCCCGFSFPDAALHPAHHSPEPTEPINGGRKTGAARGAVVGTRVMEGAAEPW